jgi:alkylated DNA repair dioxygenase AlkB
VSRQGALFADESRLPGGFRHVEEFLTHAEEAVLIEGIRTLELREAQYKEYTAKRRVASFGAGYDFDANELTPAPTLAPFLLPLRDKIGAWSAIPAEEFGYALVSEYRPGTELGWHRDVPQFEAVAGVSLAGACTMRFRPYPPRRGARVLTLDLAPRSAYLLVGDVRWQWQHSIAPTPELRYSITFRTRAR